MNYGISTGRRRTRLGAVAAVASIVLLAGALPLAPPAFAGPGLVTSNLLPGADAGAEFVPGEVVLLFAETCSPAYGKAVVERIGGDVARRSRVTPNRVVVSVPEGREDAFADAYRRTDGVLVAEKNFIYRALWVPNDTYYQYQWHFNKPDFIYAEQGWDLQRGKAEVVVAVVDTGVAYENYAVPSYETGEVVGSSYVRAPDLGGTNFVAGYDFIHNDTHPNDQNGHGTHVSGTIAQTTNNNADVAGLAHNCSIMPVQVLDYSGSGSSDVVADGVDFARQNGADVINMSLGSSGSSEVLRIACDDATAAGVVVLAASGNSGLATVFYPAAYDSVIAVGAVDYAGDLAYYSNYGDAQELVAPGGDTTVDLNGDGYVDGVLQNTFDEMYSPGPPERLANVTSFADVFLQGTSMACPHAAALAALLISHGVSPADVRQRLRESATDKGFPGRDIEYGYGLINCDAALKGEVSPENECGDCGSTGAGGGLALAGLFFGSYGFIFTRRRFFKS
jgi:serine protease